MRRTTRVQNEFRGTLDIAGDLGILGGILSSEWRGKEEEPNELDEPAHIAAKGW